MLDSSSSSTSKSLTKMLSKEASFAREDDQSAGLITISPANHDPARKMLQKQLMNETLNWFNSSQQNSFSFENGDYEPGAKSDYMNSDQKGPLSKSTLNLSSSGAGGSDSSDGSVTLKLPPISSNSRLIDYNTWVERNFGPKAKNKTKPGPFTS